MVDREHLVVTGLYLFGAALLLPLGKALHLTGISAWAVLVVALVPAPILLLQERLRFPEWLITLAAFQAVAMCAIAVLLVFVLVSLSGIRWLGFLG